jgi:histidine triad (HIT) family protein
MPEIIDQISAKIYNQPMKDDCLFCSIARERDKLVWENDTHAAFKDIHPKAATHVLVVPKAHVDSLDDLEASSGAEPLIEAIQEVARHLSVAGAYRVQINVGREGGQEIDHLHAHILAK